MKDLKKQTNQALEEFGDAGTLMVFRWKGKFLCNVEIFSTEFTYTGCFSGTGSLWDKEWNPCR